MSYRHGSYKTHGIVLVTLLSFSVPALAQEQESPPEQPSPVIFPSSPLVGAAWCTVRGTESDSGSTRPSPDGGEDPSRDSVPDESSSNLGCDVGAGLALYRFKRFPRLSWVAVLGRSTTGTGLAWTAYRPDPGGPDSGGPIIAIAIGAVVRYDVDGIYVEEVYPALGATLSFMRDGADNDR